MAAAAASSDGKPSAFAVMKRTTRLEPSCSTWTEMSTSTSAGTGSPLRATATSAASPPRDAPTSTGGAGRAWLTAITSAAKSSSR